MNFDNWLLHFTVNKKFYYGRVLFIQQECVWVMMVFDEEMQPVRDMSIVHKFTDKFLKP